LSQILQALRARPELWDLFTRKEEYEGSTRDMMDRFPFYSSADKRIFQPFVSSFMFDQGLRPEYPDGKEFAVCLSHDIDFLYEAPENRWGKTIEAFVGRDFRTSLKHLDGTSRWSNRYWNFDEIISLEKKFNARSTFFFLAGGEVAPEHKYPIDDLKQEMRKLDAGGWGIGLHGGLSAYLDLGQMRKEKGALEEALGREIVGYRGHFLKFRVPETWELLKEAGFKYDSTLAYSYCAGFRNGMCHPYLPYNLRTIQEIDILEIPLTIMDGHFFDSMKLNYEQSWEMAKRLLDTTMMYKGAISILWHNSSMSGDRLRLYERILQYCADNRAWLTSCEELTDFWNQRYVHYDW
jgi:peptidoglycan/xylan/chitin deacetylase (PgdA/CDA1 family)